MPDLTKLEIDMWTVSLGLAIFALAATALFVFFSRRRRP
jgi:LPXTG-motif cell wall-anchored protein